MNGRIWPQQSRAGQLNFSVEIEQKLPRWQKPRPFPFGKNIKLDLLPSNKRMMGFWVANELVLLWFEFPAISKTTHLKVSFIHDFWSWCLQLMNLCEAKNRTFEFLATYSENQFIPIWITMGSWQVCCRKQLKQQIMAITFQRKMNWKKEVQFSVTKYLY